jgi:hypothetical protein
VLCGYLHQKKLDGNTNLFMAMQMILGCFGFSMPNVFPMVNSFPMGNRLSMDLHENFYRRSCPQAENINRSTVTRIHFDWRDLAPSLLRLFFHDCFIQVN